MRSEGWDPDLVRLVSLEEGEKALHVHAPRTGHVRTR